MQQATYTTQSQNNALIVAAAAHYLVFAINFVYWAVHGFFMAGDPYKPWQGSWYWRRTSTVGLLCVIAPAVFATFCIFTVLNIGVETKTVETIVTACHEAANIVDKEVTYYWLLFLGIVITVLLLSIALAYYLDMSESRALGFIAVATLNAFFMWAALKQGSEPDHRNQYMWMGLSFVMLLIEVILLFYTSFWRKSTCCMPWFIRGIWLAGVLLFIGVVFIQPVFYDPLCNNSPDDDGNITTLVNKYDDNYYPNWILFAVSVIYFGIPSLVMLIDLGSHKKERVMFDKRVTHRPVAIATLDTLNVSD